MIFLLLLLVEKGNKEEVGDSVYLSISASS